MIPIPVGRTGAARFGTTKVQVAAAAPVAEVPVKPAVRVESAAPVSTCACGGGCGAAAPTGARVKAAIPADPKEGFTPGALSTKPPIPFSGPPPTSDASAASPDCWWCMLLPPPLNFACLVACQGLDYDLNSVPEDEEPGGWPGSEDIDLDDCQDLTVTKRVIDSLAAEFGTWFVAFDWCGDWLVVDDVLAVHTLRTDPAARIFVDAAISAPADLLATWPSSGWRFDDPAFDWVYLRVGYDPTNRDQCNPMVDPQTRYWLRTFVVSALRPYVAYSIARIDAGPNGDSEKVGIRIRYWAGIMNHTSFFLPTDNRNQEELTVRDLPPEVWDESTGEITGLGTLATWWMKFIRRVTIGIRWEDDGSSHEFTSSTSVTYSCDPRENVNAALHGNSYEAGSDGSPSALCFSSHRAFDAGSDEMTSYLGHTAWGEVCLLVKPSSLDSGDDVTALVAEGFLALFGNHVKVGFQVDFYGQDGSTRFDNEPHFLRREFCLRSDDLVEVNRLADEVDSFRSTASGRWMFRSFDAERLRESAAAARDLGDCTCGNGVGGGTRSLEPTDTDTDGASATLTVGALDAQTNRDQDLRNTSKIAPPR